MKKSLQKIALAVGMLWLVCVAASMITGMMREAVPENTHPSTETGESTEERIIGLLISGKIQQIPLETYVTGVLLCEMPEGFFPEAKKAQAVAARTFALRISGQGIKHGTGVICGESACCQGFYTQEEYLELGGTQDGIEQALEAVEQTKGTVITYQGQLIEATYFSCSGGKTEDAVAVWGVDVPYLQAVESPGEESAAYYTDTVQFSKESLQDALGIRLSGSPSSWFGAIKRTDGNGVETLEIGGKSYTGTELRNLLGLRSSSFSVTPLSDTVLFTTRGFGHRVGMSQYGANAMAQAGSSWQEILLHYYQNVSIDKMDK